MSFEHGDSDVYEAERGAARDAAENGAEVTPGVAEWGALQGPGDVAAAARDWSRRRAEAQEAGDAARRAAGFVRGFDGLWRLS